MATPVKETPAVDDPFEETQDLPPGRKARTLPDLLAKKLEESAKRGVAFTRTGPASVIDDLRKDLGSAAVKARYDVTTGTDRLENGQHRLTFSAKRKPVPTGS